MKAVDVMQPDLIVLAGFLVVIPAEMIAKYRNRMINISSVPDPGHFCGTGFYGLKVHEKSTGTRSEGGWCNGTFL